MEAGYSSYPKHKKFAVGVRVLENTECRNFTLLFCRGRLRNVPNFIIHVQSHLLLIKAFVSPLSRCRCRRRGRGWGKLYSNLFLDQNDLNQTYFRVNHPLIAYL